jgi:type I thyroxine 5'-deiodinase
VVYITEAHPTDIWEMQSNIRDKVLFRNPTTLEERSNVASSCVRNLHLQIPALIDSLDNHVEQAYTGWPDRLYLIDVNGRVKLKTEPGPFGFDPKLLRAALEHLNP